MMKNRDTASNPYRVPPQPSPTWIKVAVTLLAASNMSLMGFTVYLMLKINTCSSTCGPIQSGETMKAYNELLTQSKEFMRDGKEMMPQDGTKARIEENVKNLASRVDSQSEAVLRLQDYVDGLDDMCRTTCKASVESSKTIPNTHDVTLTTSGTSKLLPAEAEMLQKVPQMDYYLQRLNEKLSSHIAQAQKVCKEGHYRYGTHCYVVGEAALSQEDSKHWCSTDFGPQASLAIIKDHFTQAFISSVLPNPLHSYWVGIERPLPAGLKAQVAKTGEGLIPQNLNGKQASLAPKALSSPQTPENDFFYVDGTKVQSKVWEMWLPKSHRRDQSQQAMHDCVALSYEKVSNQWNWVEHNCGSRLGYICQYFILSS